MGADAVAVTAVFEHVLPLPDGCADVMPASIPPPVGFGQDLAERHVLSRAVRSRRDPSLRLARHFRIHAALRPLRRGGIPIVSDEPLDLGENFLVSWEVGASGNVLLVGARRHAFSTGDI